MVDPLTAASTNPNAVTNSSSTSTDKSALGKDDFLKLMMAQMKYQDPLNPMDGTAYTAQLAQFSQLEQLTNLNDNITNSINANYLLTQSINNTMSPSLIGKEVKIGSDAITTDGRDNYNLGYTLSANAAEISGGIYDENGVLVKTLDGLSATAGETKLSWDGTDNYGKKVGNGTYTLKITAADASGEDVTVSPFQTGTVTGVRYNSNGTLLVVDGLEFSVSDIQEVVNPDQPE